jgi:hypothetical protein
MCDGGEERIMTNSKGFEPLPAYFLRVSLRWFLFLFLWFPNGVYEFDDFPMLPSEVWVYFILMPNEEDSIDSVLVCNPSGKEITTLAWGECLMVRYSMYYYSQYGCECTQVADAYEYAGNRKSR